MKTQHLRLDFGDVFREEFAALLQVAGALAVEEESGVGELLQCQPGELAHVHARYHLLEQLLTGIDRVLVDVPIELGDDEVEGALLAERAPLRVDQHVGLVRRVLARYGAFGFRRLLDVAGVAARSWKMNIRIFFVFLSDIIQVAGVFSSIRGIDV